MSSALCNLLLAQLVYELGEENFKEVYAKLYGHPLLQNDDSVPGSVKSCKELYEQLLQDSNLERDPEFDPTSAKRPAPWIQKLAQLMYMAYTDQLMRDIKTDEQEFKEAVKELEDMKAAQG